MSGNKISLNDRMKRYELAANQYLPRRVPVVLRLDGRAFHTFTKGMKKPFDDILMSAMQGTMLNLCKELQGCVFAYTQSDEITFVLTDYATVSTDAWLDYRVQKMTSVAASMATVAFIKAFSAELDNWIAAYPSDTQADRDEWDYLMRMDSKRFDATFDARVFSMPRDEVCNNLIQRQNDATRNSIEAVAQAHFSQKELNGKNCNQIQEMLWSGCRINWNDLPTEQKRGACCFREGRQETIPDREHPGRTVTVSRRPWVIDRNPPIFTKDREYIERWL